MLESWARAYATRWGLSDAARQELQGVIDAVGEGRVASGGSETLPIEGVAASDNDWDLPAPNTESVPPEATETFETAPAMGGERYEDLGLIAVGGMGEVRRVWDVKLNRTVAMKVLRPDLADREDLLLRFMEEAEATAQLEHPRIIPIYDHGLLLDGRPFFTMKEVRGRTLSDVIEEVHMAATDRWQMTHSGWSFRRLIQLFATVCEAVAYAHSRGVVHRDIKPNNVMVGAFGEVALMDWGLAKVRRHDGFGDSVAAHSGAHVVITSRSHKPKYVTRSGAIAGTPNYMPPEQAQGESPAVGPWSDVYALGAVLYEVLADRAPYAGDDLDEVVAKVLAGPPPPPYPHFQHPQAVDAWPEDGLRQICAKAMSREIAGRHVDAAALAEDITGWLESAAAREQAIALVALADNMEPEILALRSRAATLRNQARELSTAGAMDRERKRTIWGLEDQAQEVETEVARRQDHYADLLKAALASMPLLREARTRLEAMEGAKQARTEGTGWLTVSSAPVGSVVDIRRFEPVDRRIVPVDTDLAGLPVPITRLELPAGSYELGIVGPKGEKRRALFRVEPNEHTNYIPPGRNTALPLAFPAEVDGTVLVSGGWFWCGGDRETDDTLPSARSWVDPFRIDVFPTTITEYAAFLADQEDPSFKPDGWSSLTAPGGQDPRRPVTGVPLAGIYAYAAWRSEKTGRTWRLPKEREWEMAARGVDERLFPWGNFLDPAWCCVRTPARRLTGPVAVDGFPEDISPWGVRGMGGNVRETVLTDHASLTSPPPPHHIYVRGGHFDGLPMFARSALRYRCDGEERETVGFRLVSSLTER